MKIKFLRLFVTAVALLAFPVMNFAQAPNLGLAATYVVFTDTGAFNATASTVIYGDIGSFVGAVNGSPTVYGNKHYSDSTAFKVSIAVDNAYSSLKSDVCGTVLGTTLGSAQTLTPGVYCTGAATTLGGNLILDAGGNSSAIFVIKIDGAFATGSSANIILKNGASYKNVYWQINGAVTVNTGSVFMGTIIANGAITFNGNSSLTGRALSISGAITLSNNKMVRDSSLMSGTTSIGAEPSPDTVCLGNSASFSVTSSGTGLTYQWRKGTTKLTNGGHISGATSDTLTINPVALSDTSSKYNVIISQGGVPIDTSANIALFVNSVTAATVASQTVCSGINTVFTVSSTSTGPAALKYQWQLSTNSGTSFSNITGANAASYTVVAPASSSDNNQYRSLVSSGSCSAFTSTVGTLRVNAVTAATVAGQTVCTGTNATFTISQTSTGSASLSYQWQSSTNGGTTFTNILGATASTYTVVAPTSLSDNYQYRSLVSSGACTSFTSTSGTLRVNAITVATVAGQTVCSGTNAVFTVSPISTGPAALTYQWLLSTNNGSTFSSITGATASSYTVIAPTGSSDNNQYEAVVTSTGCSSLTSTAGVLRVNGVSAATVANQVVCSGANATFTVSQTSSGSAALAYQWQLSTNGGTSFASITGATSSTYTVPTPNSSSDNYQYRSIVSSGTCASFTSTAGTLRVNAITAATVAGQTICSGTNAVFTVSTTSTGSAALTYQWSVSTNNGTTFSSIIGATASSYTVTAPTSASDNYQYESVVTSTGCSSITSTAGILRVNAITAATVAGETVCSGNNAVFTVSPISTGPAALTYQWLLSTNGGTTFSNISGATSSSYVVTAPSGSSDNYQYEAVVTSTGCASFTSTIGTLRVNGVSAATVAGQVVCSGTDATFTVSVTNSGPATLSYQWTESTNGGSTFSNITGATSASYIQASPSATADNYQFECIVTSGSCTSFTSTAGTLRVNAVTSATVSNQVVCSGTDATFTVSTTNTGSATLSYQWERSTDGGTTFTNISGANSTSYTESAPAASFDNYQYECIVTSGSCNPFTSTVATLRVNAITSATVANDTVCADNNALFNVIVTNTGSASLSYQWQISTDGGTSFSAISGATASTYTVSAPEANSDNYQYNCIVTSGNCASVTSTTGTLRVNSVTSALIAGQIVCSGNDATFSVLTISTGPGLLTYQWKRSTDGGSTFSNVSGSSSATYVVTAPGASSDNYMYECIVTSANCDAFTSNVTNLRVNSITSTPVSGQTVCSGTDAVFSVHPTSSGPASNTYQWQLSTNGGSSFADINGANDTIYSVIAPDATSDNYQYRNVMTSGSCTAFTSVAGILRVNDVTSASVAGQSVCSGNDATFTVSEVNTGTGFITYQWKRSTDNGVSFVNIPGATGSTFTVATPTPTSDGYQYESVVTSGSCVSLTSVAGTLSINTAPNITGGLENACVCIFTKASFWVTATGTDLTYQWRRGNVNLVDGTFISGANTSVLTVSAVNTQDTGSNYNVIVMGTCSPNDTSANAALTLCKQSGIAPNNTTDASNAVSFFPNPFSSSISIRINDAKPMNDFQLKIYNALGKEVLSANITEETTTLNTGDMPAGVYFYNVIGNNKTIQTGKLVSKQ